MTRYYSVGCNFPGYLPDNDPAVFDSWDWARDHFFCEVHSWVEHITDTSDYTAKQLAHFEALAVDYQLDTPTDEPCELGIVIAGQVYWLVETDREQFEAMEG